MERRFSSVYSTNGFTIGTARPGKAASNYDKLIITSIAPVVLVREMSPWCRNPHDMFPYVEKNGILMSVKRRSLKNGTTKVTPWTFEHIFSLIETLILQIKFN